MANRCSGFVVRCFKRTSGAPAWLVSGTIAGRQVRREFSSREDALAHAETENSRLHGRQPDQVPRLTRLSLPELRDAESACERLTEKFPGLGIHDVVRYFETLSPHVQHEKAPELAAAALRLQQKFPDVSAARAVDYYATNYRPPKSAVTLEIALENYLTDVHRRQTTGSLSSRQEKSIALEMTRLENHFTKKKVMADITDTDLGEYLRITAEEGGKTFSNKTWNNRRGYLTTLWKYCVGEKWLDDNPAKAVKKFGKRELAVGETSILRADKARELMLYLENNYEGRMVPFFALCLFAGVRPDWEDGEISKLTPEQIDLKHRVIHFRGVDTKTRRPRQTKLQPNLVEWLKAYPLDKYPVVSTNFKKLRLRARKQFGIGYDVLRHTFCTMLVGKYRSVGDAALQAGNSEKVIWGNYLNQVPETEAKEFWKILPVKNRVTSSSPAPGSQPV